MPDEVAPETPALAPPNGHVVTNSELYEALYTLDQRMDEKATLIMRTVNGVREDLSAHVNHHPEATTSLDVKKTSGMIAGLLAVVTAVLAYFKH